MFDYTKGDDNMDKLISEYISKAYESGNAQTPDISYKMGKGWPEFNLESMEKATGLNGEEYGFNPDKINLHFLGEALIEAKMPDFEVAPKPCGCGCKASEKASSKHTEIHIERDFLEADMHNMRELSDEIMEKLRPSVNDVLNEFDYEGSPLMADDIEPGFLALLVDTAMEKASQIKEVSDILQESKKAPWSKHHLLKCAFENIILIEVYGCRRLNYRRVTG